MDPARNNPIFRFQAAWWGLGVLLLFAVLALAFRLGFPKGGPDLEEAAAVDRYQVRAEIDAAQQAKLAWKEIEPGKTIQAPPREVFALVGGELLATKPAAVEKPEQRVPGTEEEVVVTEETVSEETAEESEEKDPSDRSYSTYRIQSDESGIPADEPAEQEE